MLLQCSKSMNINEKYEFLESHSSLVKVFKQKLFSSLTFTGYPTKLSSLKNFSYLINIISSIFVSGEKTSSNKERAEIKKKGSCRR